MLKSLFRRFSPGSPAAASTSHEESPPPALLESGGVAPFDFAASLQFVDTLPVPDWGAVTSWVLSIPDPPAQAAAWTRAELAWLAHLQRALGPGYRITSEGAAVLLSTLEPRVAAATLRYMTKTLSRICSVLKGVAQSPAYGKDILIVFADQDTYYRYVSRYGEEGGEFAFSSGMHISHGCGHFATHQDDLRQMEPVIAHEMTHSCLSHLPIPLWLNEGLAVNTERRLSPSAGREHTPQRLHAMHQAFWNQDTVQEFWSGASFRRPDEGNLLSYELATILVEHLSGDWDSFARFVNAATLDDAGAEAALDWLEVDLGTTVAMLFDHQPAEGWRPDAKLWTGRPEQSAVPLT